MQEVNHECYVSLELAKLLKQAGFDWDTYSAYNKDGVFTDKNRSITTWNNFADYYSAPTLEVAQRWLREVKHCEVYAIRDNCDCLFYYFAETPESEFGNSHWIECEDYLDTYEESLESGIQKCLNILLENN